MILRGSVTFITAGLILFGVASAAHTASASHTTTPQQVCSGAFCYQPIAPTSTPYAGLGYLLMAVPTATPTCVPSGPGLQTCGGPHNGGM